MQRRIFPRALENKTILNKSLIIRFTLFFLCLNLCQCFLAPRLKIKRALSTKNCSKLSRQLIYDLSAQEIKTSVSLCLQKKEYQSALLLLNYLETKDVNLREKINIWKQKADIYQNNLFLHSEAILELKKILNHQPKNYIVLHNLLKAQIKQESFNKALKTVSSLLEIENLEAQKKMEIQFVKARLLVLSKERKEALKLFTKIKEEDSKIFDRMQGAFYTALLLEEEERFEESMEKLKLIRWPFSEVKSKHWRHRKKNSAVSR